MNDIMVILFKMVVAAIGVFIAFRVVRYGFLFGKNLVYPPAVRDRHRLQLEELESARREWARQQMEDRDLL